jgi:murein DD-endopeptidase MepM/ murein hydrolase activator NlpD
MSLLPPVPNSVRSQGFGPSPMGVQPAMYGNSTRAYWQPFPGLTFYEHFHGAEDYSAPEGSAILASETGVVTYAGWRDNGGGYCVEVEIRPNVRYENVHCSAVIVRVGQRVARGQLIARVGETGTATGPHSHFDLTIREVDQYGVARTFNHKPSLYMAGGPLANDWHVQPIAPPAPYVRVNGAGINIRWRPDLSSSRFVWAVSTPNGIYRTKDGVRHCDLDQRLKFGGWVTNGFGIWGRVWMGGAYRYVAKGLIHFV